MKLNLGCGTDIKNNYVNIDLYYDNPLIKKYDIEKLNDIYEENSIDEIYASDVIEHISHKKIDNVLKSWISILKIGGKIYIKTPDINKQIECYKNKIWDCNIFSHMVFGGQDTDGNFHKCIFDSETLQNKLRLYGVNIESVSYEHDRLTNNIKTSANANFIIIGIKNG